MKQSINELENKLLEAIQLKQIYTIRKIRKELEAAKAKEKK